MDIDEDLDDAPPLLVTGDGNSVVEAPDGLQTELEELRITKVPITIVTGTFSILLVYLCLSTLIYSCFLLHIATGSD